MWTLKKRSDPPWEMDFPTEQEAITELRSHICGDCMDGIERWVGLPPERVAKPDPESAADLLGTHCGLEYDLDAAASKK